MSYNSNNGNSFNRRGGNFNPRARQQGGGRGPKKDNIHPSKFIKAARDVEIKPYIPQNSFADFEVNQLIKDNIAKRGFTNPSAIQDQSIPVGLTGQDVIGVANTGTGKTVAFAVPVIDKLLKNPNSKALIMAPTRELAQQIEEEIKLTARGSGLFGAVLIGGTAMGPQLRDLRSNPQIIVGTPGRIKDHMDRGSLKLAAFDLVVLDEVDRMLDMGFVRDIRTILSQVSEDRQSFFFSATLDRAVKDLIQTFVKNPVTISVKTGDTADSVEQDVVRYGHRSEKIGKLHDILISGDVTKVLVFDETKHSVEKLSDELIARGFLADAIHGGRSQGQRQRALNRFKSNQVNILVATDVAARGIDVSDVTHVINYSTPQTYDDYVHRVGRAGRAGRKGYALTFIEGR